MKWLHLCPICVRIGYMTTTRGRVYKVCSQFLSFSSYLLTNLALLPPHLTALHAWLPMAMETTTAAAGDANKDAEDDNQLQLPTMPHGCTLYARRFFCFLFLLLIFYILYSSYRHNDMTRNLSRHVEILLATW